MDVGPRGKEYAQVHELMRAALERSDKAGITTLTMRGKQYPTALRARPDVLVLHTLHWADEVRDPADVVPGLPERHAKADSGELRTAERLIDALTIDWDPHDYRDTHEDRVRELVAAQREGEEVVGEPRPPEATNVVDLMEALSRSAASSRAGPAASRARGARGARPARRAGAARRASAARATALPVAAGAPPAGSGPTNRPPCRRRSCTSGRARRTCRAGRGWPASS
ncbi:Ku protein [Streptomyces eurythermus]